MAILFTYKPKILIQGITGREASMVAKHMIKYGTNIMAGVTPGKGGEDLLGIPVFDTIREACKDQKADISIIYVPPLSVYNAALEAMENQIPLVLIITERVPQQDMVKLYKISKKQSVRLVGPNSVGIINPAKKVKLGPIGGDDPTRCFSPGKVGVISRSGGMTAEVSYMVKKAGYGISTAVSIGGDSLIGTSPKDLLEMFQEDDDTDAVVLFSEPGTGYEEEAADYITSNGFGKPIIAFVAGGFVENMPSGTTFGHTGAIIEKGLGKPSEKIKQLRKAGVRVATEFGEIIDLVKRSFS